MELFLDNVGIIKKSNIKLDGLTVITGKNNAGKTTVGKVVYSLIRACSNSNKVYDTYRSDYIRSQLDIISGILFVKEGLLSYYIRSFDRKDEKKKKDNCLYVLGNHDYIVFKTQELINFVFSLENELPDLTLQEYRSVLKDIFRESAWVQQEIKKAKFEEKKKHALLVIKQTISTISDEKVYENFINDRVKAHLNLVFRNQINPVREPEAVADIQLCDAGKKLLKLKVKNKDDYSMKSDTDYTLLCNQAIFMDDPFVLDNMVSEAKNLFNANNLETLLTTGIVPYRYYLLALLANRKPVNFFSYLELQNKFRPIIDKINAIVPGEFIVTKNDMFYVAEQVALDVQNLATGSKLFFMIKLLLENGSLSEDTILILDEPESHLHPEWINKFAEILVLLIRELKLRIVLTTHSPNLLLALESYVKTYAIKELAHFYLARPVSEDDWVSCLECIDDNISKGYAHLSLPLIEMSIMEKAAEEKEY